MEITKEDFEKLVIESLNEIPDYFKKHIENLEFIVMDYPTKAILKRMHLLGKGTLLGLYEGVPIGRRALGYQGVLPDRIILFRYPILYEAEREGITPKEKIKKVLMHEIGHYFGLSEEELRKRGIY